MKKVGGLVLIGLLVLSVGIYLSTSGGKEFDLSESFNLEGMVIDSGKYEPEEYEEIIGNFEEFYFENINEGEKVYIIFGNEEKVNLMSYEDVVYGDVNLFLGDTGSNFEVERENNFLQEITPSGNSVEFIISGEKYSFDLKGNERVYFIVREEVSKG